jgi:isopentenyl-diphosphate delta-isomerase type 1
MDQVILVNELNDIVGTADKDTVHTSHTPLHRAFSLFVFNHKKELLLTRRSDTKKTFPGIWTNTACGHPRPGETAAAAANRRLGEELGIVNVDVKEVSPYRYKFADKNGIVENEICPILVATFDGNPEPNPTEVDKWKWMDWELFLTDCKKNPQVYSPWSREEAIILERIFCLAK